ncbi:hypothetical protein IFR05_017396, partial [Cadophora sp. M221]
LLPALLRRPPLTAVYRRRVCRLREDSTRLAPVAPAEHSRGRIYWACGRSHSRGRKYGRPRPSVYPPVELYWQRSFYAAALSRLNWLSYGTL